MSRGASSPRGAAYGAAFGGEELGMEPAAGGGASGHLSCLRYAQPKPYHGNAAPTCSGIFACTSPKVIPWGVCSMCVWQPVYRCFFYLGGYPAGLSPVGASLELGYEFGAFPLASGMERT
eukprot:4529915-Prorocentrum_lima.AAC.1